MKKKNREDIIIETVDKIEKSHIEETYETIDMLNNMFLGNVDSTLKKYGLVKTY